MLASRKSVLRRCGAGKVEARANPPRAGRARPGDAPTQKIVPNALSRPAASTRSAKPRPGRPSRPRPGDPTPSRARPVVSRSAYVLRARDLHLEVGPPRSGGRRQDLLALADCGVEDRLDKPPFCADAALSAASPSIWTASGSSRSSSAAFSRSAATSGLATASSGSRLSSPSTSVWPARRESRRIGVDAQGHRAARRPAGAAPQLHQHRARRRDPTPQILGQPQSACRDQVLATSTKKRDTPNSICGLVVSPRACHATRAD